MKSYKELSKKEQVQAVNQAIDKIMQGILEGTLRFNDELNGDDLQERIDAAFAKAEAYQTPWFAGEIMLEDNVIKNAVQGMAICDAEDASYLDDDEPMPVRLIR